MENVPKTKAAIVAVSRDCFPIELSIKRKNDVVAACKEWLSKQFVDPSSDVRVDVVRPGRPEAKQLRF